MIKDQLSTTQKIDLSAFELWEKISKPLNLNFK